MVTFEASAQLYHLSSCQTPRKASTGNVFIPKCEMCVWGECWGEWMLVTQNDTQTHTHGLCLRQQDGPKETEREDRKGRHWNPVLGHNSSINERGFMPRSHYGSWTSRESNTRPLREFILGICSRLTGHFIRDTDTILRNPVFNMIPMYSFSQPFK